MKVSIIIPLYNTSSYIEKTLMSIIRQSFTDFEILVVDDGSTDNSCIIVEKVKLINDRIKLLKQKNSGVSSARNLGIENAKGEYIAFIDSDDIWDSNFLKSQIDFLESMDCYDWVLSNGIYIDENGDFIDNIIKNEKVELNFENLITWNIPFLAISSLVYRKSIYKGLRFNKSISSPADRDFIIKLARKKQGLYNYEKNWQYRILSNSMSKNEIKVIEDMLKQYEDYDDEFYGSHSLKRKSLNRLYFIVYRTYFKNFKIHKGLYFFSKYIFTL